MLLKQAAEPILFKRCDRSQRIMGSRDASLAELARRLLRHPETRLVVPIDVVLQAENLALQISDDLPKLLNEPSIELGAEEATVRLWVADSLAGSIGGVEPSEEVVWIPCEVKEFNDVWSCFLRTVSALTSAGYPGCIDCAGPAATEPWDEAAQRARF